MNEKVWVINDDIDLIRRKPLREKQAEQREAWAAKNLDAAKKSVNLDPPQKNPNLSFSLAMLFSGGGHMYLGLYRLGAIFALFKLLVVVLLLLTYLHRESLLSLSVEHADEMALFVFAVMFFVLVGFCLWIGGAADAYYRAVNDRKEPAVGVEKEFLPLLASLLFPGWGHFLNGQPVRGSAYLFVGMVGLFSLFVLLVAMPFWEFVVSSPLSRMYEIVVLLALSCLPVAILVWIVSVYNIFRTLLGNSVRSPLPRFSAVLGLLLTISLGMQLIPEHFYLNQLETAQRLLLQQHMTVFPDVVGLLLMLLNH